MKPPRELAPTYVQKALISDSWSRTVEQENRPWRPCDFATALWTPGQCFFFLNRKCFVGVNFTGVPGMMVSAGMEVDSR